MKILLTAKHPPGGELRIGGVQSWISTVERQLLLMGHEVFIWGPEWPLPSIQFDLGVFSHIAHTKKALPLCEQAVCVSHGIILDECPSRDLRTLFTSEEVRDHWDCTGEVVNQPIDLEFWRPRDDADRSSLVLFSYRAPNDFGLSDLAKELGLCFFHLNNASSDFACAHLQNAALVCASGRAALEALACDAPTIICDHRPYNGAPLVQPNLEIARCANYSGRGGPLVDDYDMLKLSRETMAFQTPREYVEKYHDARKAAERLITLCLQS